MAEHAGVGEGGKRGRDAAFVGAGEGAAHLGDRQSVDLRQATDVASEEGDVACAGADQRVEAGAGLGDADLRESRGGRDERVDLCRGRIETEAALMQTDVVADRKSTRLNSSH